MSKLNPAVFKAVAQMRRQLAQAQRNIDRVSLVMNGLDDTSTPRNAERKLWAAYDLLGETGKVVREAEIVAGCWADPILLPRRS